jgi:hypothetical protein
MLHKGITTKSKTDIYKLVECITCSNSIRENIVSRFIADNLKAVKTWSVEYISENRLFLHMGKLNG